MRTRQPGRDLRKNTGDPQHAAARPYCAGVLLVTLTLVMQSAGMAGLILWARSHLVRGSSSARRSRRRFARGAIHRSDPLSARIGDSVVGHFFSLEVFCDLGIRVLFFGGKLFYGWLWGSSSPLDVESRGACGGPYRCTDVWGVREPDVRDRRAAR